MQPCFLNALSWNSVFWTKCGSKLEPNSRNNSVCETCVKSSQTKIPGMLKKGEGQRWREKKNILIEGAIEGLAGIYVWLEFTSPGTCIRFTSAFKTVCSHPHLWLWLSTIKMGSNLKFKLLWNIPFSTPHENCYSESCWGKKIFFMDYNEWFGGLKECQRHFMLFSSTCKLVMCVTIEE